MPFVPVLLAGVGALAGIGLGRALERRTDVGPPVRPVWGGILGLFLGGAVGLSFFLVPPAHVGVLYHPLKGGIQMETTVPEGLHLVSPFTRRETFSVQTQEYTMTAIEREGAVTGDDSILCQTNEGLGVHLDLSVLFHVDPKRAPHLWANLGTDYNAVLIRPVVREAIRMTVARYSVVEVYSARRGEIQLEIDAMLRPLFEQFGLVLEDVKLRNVRYANKEFQGAIEEKQAAQQQVTTERRNLERAQYEKEKTINEAMGEYKAIALRAQALRENPNLVQYEMARKLGPRTKTAYLPNPIAGGEPR